MKVFVATLAIVLIAGLACSADTNKPQIQVADDGFPSGHETPEGAACDLARAFIQRDTKLFSDICIKPYGKDKGPADYNEFLKDTSDSMKIESEKKSPSPNGPKAIGKVFAVRHLSKNGPASYGYATFNFRDIMFVDVGVFLHSGKHTLNRTLVVKDRDGEKWYVHPLPDVGSGLLSTGLNDEEASKKDFRDAYDAQKPGGK